MAAGAAYAAYPVIDASHISETQKVLSEAKKQLSKLADIYTTMTAVRDQLGTMSPGGLGGANLASKAYQAVTCIIPGAGNLMLPGGRNYAYVSTCEAAEWLKESIVYDEKDPAIEWQNQDPVAIQKTINARRQWLHQQSVISSMAISKASQKNITDVRSDSIAYMAEVNTAIRHDELLRLIAKGLDRIAQGQAKQQMTLDQLLDLMANAEATQMPVHRPLANFPQTANQ